jgi:hypothetical protein
MKDQITELRVTIDGLAQLTRELRPSTYVNKTNEESFHEVLLFGETTMKVVQRNSKEIEKAYDSLILAKAWLGKVLGEIGVESPYKSGYKTVEDIEPTADVYKSSIKIFKEYGDNLSHIEKVDWLRTEIEKLVSVTNQLFREPGELTNWQFTHENLTSRMSLYLLRVEQYLSEARFWLGFELQRIKETTK